MIPDRTPTEGDDVTEHAVVIAGGGPTGLMLAAELALAGTDAVVVERRATRELEGRRAGGLHARTIEVMEQRGVAERFLEAGTTAQVAGFAFIPLDISDFPTRHPYGLALWQEEIERILGEWVDELGVPVLRGREVTGLAQDAGGVDVAVSGGPVLRARYLVGCDGGRSLVRKAAGIGFPGWDASTGALIAEADMDGEPELGMRLDERGVHALARPEEDGPVRVMVTDGLTGQDGEPDLDDLRRALTDAYGTDFGLRGARSLSRFTDTSRQAETYRDRRVLLAGDAAHVHWPAGGQGLNTGVQDAVNLGWKLGRVVAGTSPDALLDTYGAERHPVAARVLQATMAMTVLQRGGPRIDALRAVLTEVLAMDEPRRALAGTLSGLDIRYDLGEGHPLLGRRMPDLDLATAGGTVRVSSLLHDARPLLLDLTEHGEDPGPAAGRVRHVRARCDGPWELPVTGEVAAPSAVLVRPDGHVAWVGGGGGAGEALGDALAAW
ncbi:MAG: FAD-dependent monooxygenase [Thermoleophilia bacterium]